LNQRPKKRRTDPTPTKIKQQKATISSPFHDEWCCNCSKNSKCKTNLSEYRQKERACSIRKCRTGRCERIGLKTPPESQNRDKPKTHDDDQSVIPDLTPETVEPEPSSGEATKPIAVFRKLWRNNPRRRWNPPPARWHS
jgi:hypothetical protein